MDSSGLIESNEALVDSGTSLFLINDGKLLFIRGKLILFIILVIIFSEIKILNLNNIFIKK
jgi:hypothetical protein